MKFLLAGCLLLVSLTTLVVGGGWLVLISMPGERFSGDPDPLTVREQNRKISLRDHVETLAGKIGERNLWNPEKYSRARDYIQSELEGMGYDVNRQSYETRGKPSFNLEVEVAGSTRPEEVLVVSAHYDTVKGSPGANDNATGVALVLELARVFRDRSPDRTVRFVAFANEEPPFFQTKTMGSYVYARGLIDRGDDVKAMWSLETLGYYSEESGSQRYPLGFGWFYPDRGNFVGFVGNVTNRSLVRSSIETFRANAQIPSEGVALPSYLPGVSWSDQWSFWQVDFPAIMLTDTAPFRYPYYHHPGDIPERVDYEALARIHTGLIPMIESVANRLSNPADG